MEETPKPRYSIDTSSLVVLQPLKRRNFGRLWGRLDEMADAGRLLVAEEVYRELHSSADDDPVKWLREHSGIIVPTEVLWERSSVVADAHRDLVDLAKPTGSADPCVIALALVERERQQSILWGCPVLVVTQEKRKRPGRTSIADACDDYGLPVVNLQGMFDAEGWDDL
jgi:Domain of unknown function (DUF4411)